MHLLQNADTTGKYECKEAIDEPFFVYPSAATAVIKREVDKEDKHQNGKELRKAELFPEEDTRHRRNYHRGCGNQKRYMHRPLREGAHFIKV